ncbi:MAG: hypothetical protein ABIW50_07460 [Candidatus Limnocylindria bacterium]
MRDLRQRLLIGLGVVAAGTMAIGYAFIFGGVATPPGGDLGRVPFPDAGEARAIVLDDGRPAFVVTDLSGQPWVLDAQVPGRRSRLGSLVVWCPDTRTFSDPFSGALFSADGELIAGPGVSGLVAFAVRPEGVDDRAELIVGSWAEPQPVQRDSNATPLGGTCADEWLMHRPARGEVFDPSVAADQEPPGWIWLEGSVQVVDGQVRLCDGLDGGCAAYAAVLGIDPASVTVSEVHAAGLFIGRMREDEVEGLVLAAPFTEES